MQDLNKIWVLIYPVIDNYGSVKYLTDAGPLCHRISDIRKVLQQVDMIKYGVPKLLGSGRVIDPRIGKDFLEFR